MASYKIIGRHGIAGHAPGDTVSGDDLADVNVEHLIAAGHLQPVASASKKSAAAPVDKPEQPEQEH